MQTSGKNSDQPGLLFRGLAFVCALLVLALTVFAANPDWHAKLHGADKASVAGKATHSGPSDHPSPLDDDGCAVVLFANGLVLAVIAFLVVLALERLVSSILRKGELVYHRSLRYWHPPLCGPPLS